MSQNVSSKDPIRTHLENARTQIAQGQLKEAAHTLNTAQSIFPNDARIFMLAGLMAEKSGNAKAALDQLRKTVALAPDWAPGILELALLLARQNQFPEALRWADRAITLDAQHPSVIAGTIDIAHRAGDLPMAVRYIEQGLRSLPNNVPLRMLLGRDLRAMQRWDESLQVWETLLQALPAQQDVHYEKVLTLVAAGQPQAALSSCEFLLQAAPDNTLYQYYHAIAQGQTPAHQPADAYVPMFDQMAANYDLHMFQELGYRLPKLVAAKILAQHPDKKINVLDLGCGTGLLGVFLGKLDGYLIGVEQSLKMLEQAARHQVYDKFHTVDLKDALQNTPDNLYEYITALDVFIYVGDLGQAIPHALRILKPAGTFIFSCEQAPADGADLVLLPENRYAHKVSHIVELCQKSGFADVQIEEMSIRQEAGQPVPGFLVTARKA